MAITLVSANLLFLALKLAFSGFLIGHFLEKLEASLKETPYEILLIALTAAFIAVAFAIVYLELPY